MRPILLLVRREMASYFKSPMGYVLMTAILVVLGLLFNGYAMKGGSKLSSQVLSEFFHLASGTTMVAAIFISMRLLAEERQLGTLTLLMTSPLHNWHIVMGKFLAAFLFLSMITLISIYMPMLIFVHGMVSVGHIFSGYLGLLLLGAACIAIGTFASAIAPNQLIAVVLSAVLVVSLLVCYLLSAVTEPPVRSIVSYLALYNKHFVHFREGIINSRDVVFYGSLVYVFLYLSTQVVAAKRWR